MKKLVSALLIALPIILLIALFATVNLVSVSMDIPATGICITAKGDGIFLFDLANYTHPLYESDLAIEVLPLVASNRAYTINITDESGSETSDVAVLSQDGTFTLLKAGVAKVTCTSEDGGFCDSVIFDVIASGATDFTPVLTQNGLQVPVEQGDTADFKATISSGEYNLSANCEPKGGFAKNLSLSLSSESSNALGVCIGEGGNFSARFDGTYTLEMTLLGTKTIKKTLALTVTSSAPTTINGQPANGAIISGATGFNSVNFHLQTACPKEQISASGDSVLSLELTQVSQNSYIAKLNLANAQTAPETKTYTLTAGGQSHNFKVQCASPQMRVHAPAKDLEDTIIAPNGTLSLVSVLLTQGFEKVEYNFEVEGTCFSKQTQGNECLLKATSIGEATLKITCNIYENGNKKYVLTETQRLLSVVPYSSLLFTENSESYGLGELTIAKHKFSGDVMVPATYQTAFKARSPYGIQTDYTDLIFSSSSDCIVIENSVEHLSLGIQSNGTSTISAKWKYGDLFDIKPATLTLGASTGVYVSSRQEMEKAFSTKTPVVLTSDIYLGEDLFIRDGNAKTPKYSSAEMHRRLLTHTTELPTTADFTYYENLDLPRPSVRYCLDIVADIHGNGHTISAEYITSTLNSMDNPYDFSVFCGPLDFVATNADGTKLASVKGQDNIVFLVRTDGVSIDNVTLSGCDDSSLYSGDTLDLSLLTTMGTTLELMADASITRSRIKNGRTVIRAFGRDNVNPTSKVENAEKINVTIDGCLLQNAREFLIKMGTNRTVRGTNDNPSPLLLNSLGEPFPAHNSSACDTLLNDDDYIQNFVLTDVVLKDSTLRTSGLFSIAIETHFAGDMLAGKRVAHLSFPGWYDLAATSYPALLHLVGDVVLDDWKELSKFDSSTLIETNGLPMLAFDIVAIFNSIRNDDSLTFPNLNDGTFESLIVKRNGKEFVHGGIIFYGGGKNYSAIDTTLYTSSPFADFNVNLSILEKSPDQTISLQGRLLPLAAGTEDFRFLLLTNM